MRSYLRRIATKARRALNVFAIAACQVLRYGANMTVEDSLVCTIEEVDKRECLSLRTQAGILTPKSTIT